MPRNRIPHLQDRAGAVQVLFAGRAESLLDREETFHALAPAGYAPVWLRQIHSAEVMSARAGCVGEGDALVARAAGEPLALAIVTADCVPVLLAGDGEIAAAHAGWRGLAAGVLPAVLDRLRTPAAEIVAWIGPSIGPCCYEVSDEVAEQIVAVSSPTVVRPGRGARPHLDLTEAADVQLQARGVGEIRRLGPCTRCDPRWWSYRRDSDAAGRNIALIWSN